MCCWLFLEYAKCELGFGGASGPVADGAGGPEIDGARRRGIELVFVAGAVEVIVIQVEVEGAFAFGEHEFAELIVDLGIDGEVGF